ncbi:TetR/AcrR family transcriptional regulator [Paenibacillus hexagrammi]|uniref:TetR/AcrR family transcriptional regulator n=1 Tax=Paenibacillus hexagrammi TaxID=2908839 RepID=A0ABY3SPV6_9BACL|nr:TetR/AcrR family transcriptional regulator [Paenibacillus sp. YPD9-1]UJF35719.1 TetR/AcrR family transcriptional regulator [Paenibacillus sp. YPD9-1]
MPVNPNDPRVSRTRQFIMQAFTELVEEQKNVYSISVQDITTRANINRATFYAHFDDKYVFLECWISRKFQILLMEALPQGRITGIGSLRAVVQTVFDVLARFRQYMVHPGNSRFEPLFEVAMQKELYHLLREWLNEESTGAPDKVETTALVASWGIFGAALQWSRDQQNRTSETMVPHVLEVAAAALATVLEE